MFSLDDGWEPFDEDYVFDDEFKERVLRGSLSPERKKQHAQPATDEGKDHYNASSSTNDNRKKRFVHVPFVPSLLWGNSDFNRLLLTLPTDGAHDVYNDYILAWLNLRDVMSCCQVCKGWNQEMRSQAWIKAARNENNGRAFQALCSEFAENPKVPPVDAKDIAIALSRRPSPGKMVCADAPSKEGIIPSVVFLLFELSYAGKEDNSNDRKEKVVFCKSIEQLRLEHLGLYTDSDIGVKPTKLDNLGCPEVDMLASEVLQIFDFTTQPTSIYSRLRHCIRDRMEMTLRLFRADTGQSYTLSYRMPYDKSELSWFDFEEKSVVVSGREFVFNASVDIQPIYPLKDSRNEPNWSKEMRKMGEFKFSSIRDYQDYLDTEFKLQVNATWLVNCFCIDRNDEEHWETDTNDEEYWERVKEVIAGLGWE